MLPLPRCLFTDISTQNTADLAVFSAYKAVPIAPTLSLPKEVEYTFNTYPKSFTYSWCNEYNPILLCCCLGTVSSLLLCFNPLALNLINWLTGWNYARVERPGLSVLHESLRVTVFTRQRYSIFFY